MAEHYPECECHRDGSPDCCICWRLEEHARKTLADLRAKAAERARLTNEEFLPSQEVVALDELDAIIEEVS